MELIEIWSALLRRKWVLLQAIVFFTLAGLVAAATLPKQYQATAKLMVSSSDTSMSVLADLGLQEVAMGLSSASDEIQNHIALSTTRPNLDKVIWRLQLRNDDGFLLEADKLLIPGIDAPITAPPQLVVQQHQGTDIILVTATSDDPELSRLMADTLARVYINDTQERARLETSEARKFVETRLEVVKGEFERALQQISDTQEREQVLDLESEMREAVNRLSDLYGNLETNRARIRELEGRVAELRSVQERERPDYLGPATLTENAELRGLRDDLTKLTQTRDAMLLDRTEKHPDVLELDSRIATVQRQLDVALQQQKDFDPTLVQLEAELAGLRRSGDEVAASIDRTTSQFSAYPGKLAELGQLQLSASAAEEVYRSLQDQRYQIAIAEAMTMSPLQLIEPAQRPERPVFPKLLPSLVLGLALGTIAGLGLVALFEYIDDSVKTPEDLRQAWDVAQLGQIPRYDVDKHRTIAPLAPTHLVVEAFRTLRSGIAYATLDKPARLLSITSAVPSEGKSTVVVNLAISYAKEGRRVLIVDGDMRRPNQHRYWPGMRNDVGVTSVLLGEVGIEVAARATEVENLSVLLSGKVPTDPGTLVESLRMRQLLLEATKRWDVVIVDSPPALVVNDALVLGRQVDHVLCVVEANATSRRLIHEVRERLSSGGVEPLGLVLQKVDYRASGYGYYYKRAYAAYYRPDEDKPGKSEQGSKGGAA